MGSVETGLEAVRAVEVRAAGAVVWRPGPEIAVIHRPRQDDWSLPKGKLDPGEAWHDAAVREVWEETGLTGRMGEELEPVLYRDRKGRSKGVRYWLMEAVEGDFNASHEVDELRWVAFDDAIELLTYEYDRELVRHAAARLVVT